jgi:hypothetical protein
MERDFLIFVRREILQVSFIFLLSLFFRTHERFHETRDRMYERASISSRQILRAFFAALSLYRWKHAHDEAKDDNQPNDKKEKH